jgi:hypothetical protein
MFRGGVWDVLGRLVGLVGGMLESVVCAVHTIFRVGIGNNVMPTDENLYKTYEKQEC